MRERVSYRGVHGLDQGTYGTIGSKWWREGGRRGDGC